MLKFRDYANITINPHPNRGIFTLFGLKMAFLIVKAFLAAFFLSWVLLPYDSPFLLFYIVLFSYFRVNIHVLV
jgi:hypothetical protein